MFDQVFENVRKASESSLQMQQDMIKYWSQQWVSMPQNNGGSSESSHAFQKRWSELAIEILNRHRESLDLSYRTTIQVMEQSFHVSEAKSPEDYRRMVEDALRKLFATIKEQSEAQFSDLQKWAAKSFDMLQKVAE